MPILYTGLSFPRKAGLVGPVSRKESHKTFQNPPRGSYLVFQENLPSIPAANQANFLIRKFSLLYVLSDRPLITLWASCRAKYTALALEEVQSTTAMASISIRYSGLASPATTNSVLVGGLDDWYSSVRTSRTAAPYSILVT